MKNARIYIKYIESIQERVKEKRRKALKKANKTNPNHTSNRFGSAEPNQSEIEKRFK